MSKNFILSLLFYSSNKGLEVVIEAFPQVILGAFTIQALQLWETLNILSFLVSLFSLVYGLGDFLIIIAEKKEFIYTLWGSLAIVVDSLLRTLFLAYFLSITKAYTFLFVLSYFIILYLTICISKKQMKLKLDDISMTMFSFTCSGAMEDRRLGYKLRSRSKMVFSVLFIFSFAFVIASTHTDSLSHIGLSMNSSDVSLHCCKNICGKEYDNFCLERWKHLPQSQHTNIQIILSVLFGLSILEWILESCTDFMPYTQFYKESESDSDPKGGLISEGILTLVPLTNKGAKYLP